MKGAGGKSSRSTWLLENKWAKGADLADPRELNSKPALGRAQKSNQFAKRHPHQRLSNWQDQISLEMRAKEELKTCELIESQFKKQLDPRSPEQLNATP